MTIVAFTGIREIDLSMADEVEMVVLDEISAGATEMRFGGAVGADTMALRAACNQMVQRVAYVPFLAKDQPPDAHAAIRSCANSVRELHLKRSNAAYLERNRIMITGADRVVAFTDGRATGGTAHTIRVAEQLGIPVMIVPVESVTKRNPSLRGDFSAKVFGLSTYVSASERHDPLSDLVRRNKLGEAIPKEIRTLARRLVEFISLTPNLVHAKAIVAMPHMQTLAELIADDMEIEVGALERIEEPTGGQLLASRMRFPADVHERTMKFLITWSTVPGRHPSVIVLDNVVTTGRTMEGALRAVARTGAKPVGLGVLFSASLEQEP